MYINIIAGCVSVDSYPTSLEIVELLLKMEITSMIDILRHIVGKDQLVSGLHSVIKGEDLNGWVYSIIPWWQGTIAFFSNFILYASSVPT